MPVQHAENNVQKATFTTHGMFLVTNSYFC